MNDHAVINGSFEAIETNEPRSIVSSAMDLIVQPEGKTAAFARTGLKIPDARKVVAFVGEMDGVRVYATRETNGKIYIVMTRQDMKV